MSLTVEDGTGVAGAESYISATDCGTYAAARGLAFDVSDSDHIALAEQALRRATTWLDNTYRNRFVGFRTHRRDQGLEWPRVAAYYYNPQSDGSPVFHYRLYEYDTVDSATVPPEIISACCEAAVRELASPGSLTPDVTPGKVKKRVRVGPIETEYATGLADARSQTPVVQLIDGMIAPLLATNGQSPYSGKAVRA